MIKFGANLVSLGVQRNLAQSSAELGATSERLASGQRINRASDDAAGLAIASSLNINRRIFNQGIRNLNDGFSFINIADSAISEITDLVIRIEELAIQASN